MAQLAINKKYINSMPKKKKNVLDILSIGKIIYSSKEMLIIDCSNPVRNGLFLK